MGELDSLEDAFVLIKDGLIQDYGNMADCPQDIAKVIDIQGRFAMPCWCDSHTHLVFAKSREKEFVDRINGLSYTEIAAKGGGILNSAKKLNETSEEELFQSAWERLMDTIEMGTGAIEIKSGYGLSLDGELKMLRTIKKLKKHSPIPVKATFLAAHALPEKYKLDRRQYLNLVLNEMLPQIAEEQLADYIDVFCEKGFFDEIETGQILKAGKQYGLRGKIHTNQFNSIGGIEAAIEHGALSVDHLEVMTDEEINSLAKSNVIPTLLPSAPFFLNDPFPPARKLIAGGMPVVLASDFNPGSSPSANMSLVVALACIKMKMTPEEAINAATINGAFAMEIDENYGSITEGKVANIIITKPIPSLAYLPYAFGNSSIDKVIVNGKEFDRKEYSPGKE